MKSNRSEQNSVSFETLCPKRLDQTAALKQEAGVSQPSLASKTENLSTDCPDIGILDCNSYL